MKDLSEELNECLMILEFNEENFDKSSLAYPVINSLKKIINSLNNNNFELLLAFFQHYFINKDCPSSYLKAKPLIELVTNEFLPSLFACLKECDNCNQIKEGGAAKKVLSIIKIIMLKIKEATINLSYLKDYPISKLLDEYIGFFEILLLHKLDLLVKKPVYNVMMSGIYIEANIENLESVNHNLITLNHGAPVAPYLSTDLIKGISNNLIENLKFCMERKLLPFAFQLNYILSNDSKPSFLLENRFKVIADDSFSDFIKQLSNFFQEINLPKETLAAFIKDSTHLHATAKQLDNELLDVQDISDSLFPDVIKKLQSLDNEISKKINKFYNSSDNNKRFEQASLLEMKNQIQHILSLIAGRDLLLKIINDNNPKLFRSFMNQLIKKELNIFAHKLIAHFKREIDFTLTYSIKKPIYELFASNFKANPDISAKDFTIKNIKQVLIFNDSDLDKYIPTASLISHSPLFYENPQIPPSNPFITLHRRFIVWQVRQGERKEQLEEFTQWINSLYALEKEALSDRYKYATLAYARIKLTARYPFKVIVKSSMLDRGLYCGARDELQTFAKKCIEDITCQQERIGQFTQWYNEFIKELDALKKINSKNQLHTSYLNSFNFIEQLNIPRPSLSCSTSFAPPASSTTSFPSSFIPPTPTQASSYMPQR